MPQNYVLMQIEIVKWQKKMMNGRYWGIKGISANLMSASLKAKT